MTKVSSNFIKAGGVGTSQLADGSATSDKLGAASVITAKLADRNVTTVKIALNGVTDTEIASGALVERHYSGTSIPTTAYQLLSVGTGQLADAGVTGVKVAAGAIGAVHIGDDQVNQNHYADSSIQTAHLADQSVNTAKLGNQSVTVAKMQLFTAGRLLYANGSGVMAEFPAGSNGQILTTSGGALAWGTAALPTGLLCPFFGATAPSGWVLANGTTVGNTASGADQASDTYQLLFEFLWNSFNQTILPVTGGRGVSAAADWAANKKIALPDMRGRVPVGVETSETSSGRVDPTLLDNGAATQIGSTGGDDKIALTTSLIPEHTHALLVDGTGSNYTTNKSGTNAIYTTGDQSNDATYYMTYTATYITPTLGKSGPAGTGSAPEHENMQPFMLVNYIMKV